MIFNVEIISLSQVIGDIACSFLSFLCIKKGNKDNRYFFIFNSIAFLFLAIGDIYYNYSFRISHQNIQNSIGLAVILPMFIFQITQAYNWYSLIKKQKTIILSTYNIPYLLFTLLVIGILVYYFINGQIVSSGTTWYQSISVSLDMLIWFFTIICLARASSLSVILLTLGGLMLISSDLTTRSLFMFEMNELASVTWIHIIWTWGVLIMMGGFFSYLFEKDMKFCHYKSIQANCISWISTTSFFTFIIGFIFLSFFKLSYNVSDIYLSLWSLPIALMFMMITSVLLGKCFSNTILAPVSSFLRKIEFFNLGKDITAENNLKTKIYELNILGGFIDASFYKLNDLLNRERKLSSQVAHDIRSPLAALDSIVKRLPGVDEPQRILLTSALNHIRDIANNLEKDISPYKSQEEKAITQIADLIEYVLSERRAAFINHTVQIVQNFNVETYSFFIDVIPSVMRRVLTNIINNAYEAIILNGGIIYVDIIGLEDAVQISIQDNGMGISDMIFSSLFQRGFTTKQNGSGLGLFYAKENIEEWGGKIEINSKENSGTIVIITLPAQQSPSWFTDKLIFNEKESIICVDDNISIWHAWNERFKDIKESIELIYCNSKETLQIDLQKKYNFPRTYLIDYEFSGKDYTGFELIELIQAQEDPNVTICLVTSHANEDNIQKFCQKKEIFIIPKFFVPKIKIEFI